MTGSGSPECAAQEQSSVDWPTRQNQGSWVGPPQAWTSVVCASAGVPPLEAICSLRDLRCWPARTAAPTFGGRGAPYLRPMAGSRHAAFVERVCQARQRSRSPYPEKDKRTHNQCGRMGLRVAKFCHSTHGGDFSSALMEFSHSAGASVGRELQPPQGGLRMPGRCQANTPSAR